MRWGIILIKKMMNKEDMITIESNICFECGSDMNIHNHHVVAEVLGGTKTIPLCGDCHGKVHGKNFGLEWKRLQSIGILKARLANPTLYNGRSQNTKETKEQFLTKHSNVVQYLEKGMKGVEINKLYNISLNTITKIKKNMIKSEGELIH